jgi:two-component system sensor histidine kinase RstB
MTRLFIRFYLGVLVVLFLAWYIHGAVSQRRVEAEWARVIEGAHSGGVRLVASELNASLAADRDRVLNRLRQRFVYPIEIVPSTELSNSLQRRISRGGDVVVSRIVAKKVFVIAALANGVEVVQLGPFPDYDLKEIEDSIGGWMRLTADKLNATPGDRRAATLTELQRQFAFPIDIANRQELPDWPRGRVIGGAKVVFFSIENDRWMAATPLAEANEVVRFGPFPSFENIGQKTATTTLGLVLLPVALAIALLLRPVARQLRHVEYAAKAIASGDLSTRVDERRLRAAKPLAEAFNHMADRTESLVRTQRELLQAVSHELRTPLSRMRFAIELIRTAEDDADRILRLESLDAATEELDELVGELLGYVRMETAEQTLSCEPIAVSDILEVLIPKQLAVYPNIDFQVIECESEQDETVYADRNGFQRVLENLLNNAGRYAKSRVTIHTKLTNSARIVDVDDDGTGIPESDRSRVFEPFVRLGDNTNGRGVGLGLALVKRIVTQHDGRVDVLTSPDGGCRIRTTWPLPS